MLRIQRHNAALAFCQRKIEAKQQMLDDVQSLMAEIEEDTLLRGHHTQKAMWMMLDDIVWKVVEEIATIDRMVCKVLRSNKDHDEDEAWEEYGFCGLPLIGQPSIRDLPRHCLKVVYPPKPLVIG
jgi:hypothetical protein